MGRFSRDKDKPSIKWYFEPKTRGSTHGLVDAAQEFFMNDSWNNGVREVIQNSLDAARSKNDTVKVSIQLIRISSEQIKAKELLPHFKQALNKATKSKHRRQAQKSLEAAIGILTNKEMDVLAITDTGTTGLVEDAWMALVHSEGSTYKSGNAAGGSFGIGKNAPYIASGIRTVFYYTRYGSSSGDVEKLMGRCKLITHPNPKDKSKSLNPIGFFSAGPEGEDYAAIQGSKIPDAFRTREKNGSTSVFIMGFKHTKDWETQTARSVAHNFFKAILDKKLVVNVGERTIDEKELENLMENDTDLSKKTAYYYRLAKQPEHTLPIENRFGKFQLLFSIDSEVDSSFPNRLAYVNRRGMTITDAKQFGKNPFAPKLGDYFRYIALLQAADDDTDECIRKLETPNHQSIEYQHAKEEDNFKEIESDLRDIRMIIMDTLRAAMNAAGPNERINIGELARLIPMSGVGDNPGGAGHIHVSSIKRKTPSFGSRGADVDVMGTEPSPVGPKPPPGPEPGPIPAPNPEPGPSGGRKSPSSFERTSVKRHDNTLRLWLYIKSGIKSIKFHISPVGEQIQKEASIMPADIRVISPTGVNFSSRASIITIDSPPGRVVMDVDVKMQGEYSAYMVREVKERPAKTGGKAKN